MEGVGQVKFSSILAGDGRGLWYCQQVINQGFDAVVQGMQLSNELWEASNKTLTPLQADIAAAKQILGL